MDAPGWHWAGNAHLGFPSARPVVLPDRWLRNSSRSSTLSYQLGVLLLCFQFINAWAASNTEILILDRPEQVAGGASRHTPFFQVGGIEGLGLFVGQPNPLLRDDRVLLRFDLAKYPVRLRDASPLERATLRLQVAAVVSPRETERALEVSYSRRTPTPFTGFDLVRADFVTLKQVDVPLDAAGRWFAIDVTNAVNEAFNSGLPGVVFRIRDPAAEQAGNPYLEASGILIGYPGEHGPRLELKFRREAILPAASANPGGS